MANNLTSNWSRQVMRVFMKHFEASRVLCKSVNTQLFAGKFSPKTGSIIDVKRPHAYKMISTADGDISLSTKSDIISGKASAVVQNYITGATEWGNIEEALELDQLDQILEPMARDMVTDLERRLGLYMMTNCNLSVGTPGTPITTWQHVANQSALMQSIGVPQNTLWHSVINPFTMTGLANAQNGLSPAQRTLVETAWEQAEVSQNFAGMRVSSSNLLPTRNVTTAAQLAGTLSATPTLTYVAHKDTMIQEWAVTGFTSGAVAQAGDIVQVTGKGRANIASGTPAVNAAGAAILFRGVITENVTLTGGNGVLKIAGAGIWEANGAYNTTSTALASGDVVTILGTSGALVQPSLFYHPDAFALATVKLPKLYSTDTVAVTEDGISIRVSRYADGDSNKQNVRFDMLPAFGTLNPFFAGQGFGG